VRVGPSVVIGFGGGDLQWNNSEIIIVRNTIFISKYLFKVYRV
jgi:hypothetical protein